MTIFVGKFLDNCFNFCSHQGIWILPIDLWAMSTRIRIYIWSHLSFFRLLSASCFNCMRRDWKFWAVFIKSLGTIFFPPRKLIRIHGIYICNGGSRKISFQKYLWIFHNSPPSKWIRTDSSVMKFDMNLSFLAHIYWNGNGASHIPLRFVYHIILLETLGHLRRCLLIFWVHSFFPLLI